MPGIRRYLVCFLNLSQSSPYLFSQYLELVSVQFRDKVRLDLLVEYGYAPPSKV
jgi:hypothetical protein